MTILKGERGRRRRWCKNSFCILQLMMEDKALYFRPEWPACRPELSSAGNVTCDEAHTLTTETPESTVSPPVMYHSRTKLKSAFKAATLPSHCACEGWQYGKHFRISIQQRGTTYVVNIRLLSKEQNKEETKCSCCKCFFGRRTRKFKWFVIWLKDVRLICSGRWLINLIGQTRKEM